MTLVLTLANIDQFIQISDRKLSSGKANHFNDANKASFLHFENGQYVYGYAGLAKVGNWDADSWILDTLLECAPPDFHPYKILERFSQTATNNFSKPPISSINSSQDRRFCIALGGFVTSTVPPLGTYDLVSNYHDRNGNPEPEARADFAVIHIQEQQPGTNTPLIRLIGNTAAFTSMHNTQLTDLLIKQKPKEAIINKAIEIMLEIAASPKSEGTIGNQYSIICLPRDPKLSPESFYYSDSATSTAFMPNDILITPKNGLFYSGITFSAAEPAKSLPFAGPKLEPNRLCWCGSGEKYKRCHGKKQIASPTSPRKRHPRRSK